MVFQEVFQEVFQYILFVKNNFYHQNLLIVKKK